MKSFRQFIVESMTEVKESDFPALLSLPDQYGKIHKYLTFFIQKSSEAIQNGSLIKAQFDDIKGAASSLLESGFWSLKERHVYNGNAHLLPDELRHYEFQPNHSGLVTSTLNKALKLTVDHPYKSESIKLLQELQKVEAVLIYLKERIVAKQTKAEVAAKAAFNAPQATKDAVGLMTRILTDMTNKVKDEYIQQMESQWNGQITEFFAKEHQDQLKHLNRDEQSRIDFDNKNEEARKRHKEIYGHTRNFVPTPRPKPSYLESVILPIVSTRKMVSGDPVWTQFPDWKHRVHLQAVEQARLTIEAFISKNVRKLASIIEAKNNLSEDPYVVAVHCQRGIIEGEIRFKFKDGSHFFVRNKVISKFYQAADGNWATMYQFPTTFHDAILPNGKRMSGQPSEEQMNSIFAKS